MNELLFYESLYEILREIYLIDTSSNRCIFIVCNINLHKVHFNFSLQFCQRGAIIMLSLSVSP